ncbi:MAG TPA: HAMP domain-containing sensor histidine kinase [Xanthomonadaceae bacterium]|nr:HAMP domain-containing sensor histidine kinase [Xanthomonadaceae bacterium]
MREGLPRRLRWAVLVQLAIACMAVLAGSWLMVGVAKHTLVERMLARNAAYYWAQRESDPDRSPPDTEALHGYVVQDGGSAAGLPESLRALDPGLHEVDALVVLVEQRDDTRLYLTYPRGRADELAMMVVVAPILIALLALGLSSFATYRLARALIAPLHWLAREVRRWDPMDPRTAALAPDKLPAGASLEVRELAGALLRMGERMRAFVRRERDFTRDASHELRTPLTVIRVATDLLGNDPDLPQRAQRSLSRIQRAGRDMETVIEAFLVLARESSIEPAREDFAVRDVVDEEVQKARPLLAGKPVELTVEERASPRLHASPRVLAVMLGNLLRNACAFTDEGLIEVVIAEDHVAVADTGIGMSAETLERAFEPFYRANPDLPEAKGMGLSIVRRLGERFGWPVTLESSPGRGTTAIIHFVARR